MAICYECGEQFYGIECPHCGNEINYSCWACYMAITRKNEKCEDCAWYICINCGACGCNEERPPSKEEELEVI